MEGAMSGSDPRLGKFTGASRVELSPSEWLVKWIICKLTILVTLILINDKQFAIFSGIYIMGIEVVGKTCWLDADGRKTKIGIDPNSSTCRVLGAATPGTCPNSMIGF